MKRCCCETLGDVAIFAMLMLLIVFSLFGLGASLAGENMRSENEERTQIEDVAPYGPVKTPGAIQKTFRADEACLLTCDDECDRCALSNNGEQEAVNVCETARDACYGKCLQEKIDASE